MRFDGIIHRVVAQGSRNFALVDSIEGRWARDALELNGAEEQLGRWAKRDDVCVGVAIAQPRPCEPRAGQPLDRIAGKNAEALIVLVVILSNRGIELWLHRHEHRPV